MRRCVYRMYDH